jgi:O-antigen/teichoic acid export membrane protein
MIFVVLLVLANAGAIGIVTGYISFEVLASIVLSLSIYGIFRSGHEKPHDFKLIYPFKKILNASIPGWIPKLVSILGGSNLGTIVVFGFNGSAHAASYFLANAIFSAVSTISAPLFTVAYPALSAMSDGRKRLAWRILKISIILSLPVSASLFFYSDDIIQLLGDDYNDASLYLKIFMITILPNSISTMITQLVYAYGNYRQVLFLGLASSLPRTVLYFILVPAFGATGAVISFLIGSVIGLVVSITVANKIDMVIDWKSLVFMATVAFLPAFAFSYTQINYVIGIMGTIAVSFIIFLKLRILTRYDIEDTLSVLPERVARPLITILDKLGRSLTKSY